MTVETLDLIAGWASLVLTLLIFSYLLGDNWLYRIAVHILVGASAAYVAIVAVESVIAPWFALTVFAAGDSNLGVRAFGIIPLLLALFLLLKQLPRLAPLGNLSLAFIIGIGVGVAIVGAVVGTILPLGAETAADFDEGLTFNAVILAVGTLCTLVYFQYLAKRDIKGQMTRRWPLRLAAGFGQGILVISLGAIYGGVILTSLSILSSVISEQLTFLLEQIG